MTELDARRALGDPISQETLQKINECAVHRDAIDHRARTTECPTSATNHSC
jgi:hypothetical protein